MKKLESRNNRVSKTEKKVTDDKRTTTPPPIVKNESVTKGPVAEKAVEETKNS